MDAPNKPPKKPEISKQATQKARVSATAAKAKIAFEGSDEFSIASLDPQAWNDPVELKPRAPARAADEPEQKGFLWKALRKIFQE